MKLQLLSGLGLVNGSDTMQIINNSGVPQTANSLRNDFVTKILSNSNNGEKLAPFKNMEAAREVLTTEMNTSANTVETIPASSKFYASYIDVKNNPSKYNHFLNVPAFLAALEEAYSATKKGETEIFTQHLIPQLNVVYPVKYTNNLSGEGRDFPSTDLLSSEGSEKAKASSAAVTAFIGIPIPPGVFDYITGVQDWAQDKIVNSINDFFGWSAGDNGKDMPNGGITIFYKYMPGQERFNQPIINEKMSIGYFKSVWKKQVEADADNKIDFYEMEVLFKVYLPILRPNVDYKTQKEFWNKVIEIEKIRKNPPNLAVEAKTSGQFDWVGGQSNNMTGFHVANGTHALKAGDLVVIEVKQGDTSFNGVHKVEFAGASNGTLKDTMFTINIPKKGAASGNWAKYIEPNGGGGNSAYSESESGNKTNLKPYYIIGGLLVGGGLLYAALKPKKSK